MSIEQKPDQRIAHAVYPYIGYGRYSFAYSLREWAKTLDYTIEPLDVLALNTDNLRDEIKALAIKTAYQSLSQFPGLYYYLRMYQESYGYTGFMDSEVLTRAQYQGDGFISVSPNASLLLANIPHYALTGDVFIPQSFIQPGLKGLFVFDDDHSYTSHLSKTQGSKLIPLHGMILPPNFVNFPEGKLKEERIERLQEGNPKIVIATHGAGELGTIFSLVHLRKPLKEGRVHVCYFVGRHRNMKIALEALASIMGIEINNNMDELGKISILYATTNQVIMALRETFFPEATILVTPTANENTGAGINITFGKPRNPFEETNANYGVEKGFLKKINSPKKLWAMLERLFGPNGTGIQMDRVLCDNFSFDATRVVIQTLIEEGFFEKN